MKHLYLNLKRFDVPTEFGGVNRLAPIQKWGEFIVKSTQEQLKKYSQDEVEFIQFFPEAHIIPATLAKDEDSLLQIGHQGLHYADTAVGGAFGAFTSSCPASAVVAMGCDAVIIGHCEERENKMALLKAAGCDDKTIVNRFLNMEIQQAVSRGLKVLYCIGERSEEQECWQETLQTQLEIGLKDINKDHVVIGYEPIWSIGPNKKPADQAYITKVARFIKEITGGIDVVYGGGLKADNAQMLSSIQEIDGALIALTRFTGEIGFYPEEYLEIIRLYLGK